MEEENEILSVEDDIPLVEDIILQSKSLNYLFRLKNDFVCQRGKISFHDNKKVCSNLKII